MAGALVFAFHYYRTYKFESELGSHWWRVRWEDVSLEERLPRSFGTLRNKSEEHLALPSSSVLSAGNELGPNLSNKFEVIAGSTVLCQPVGLTSRRGSHIGMRPLGGPRPLENAQGATTGAAAATSPVTAVVGTNVGYYKVRLMTCDCLLPRSLLSPYFLAFRLPLEFHSPRSLALLSSFSSPYPWQSVCHYPLLILFLAFSPLYYSTLPCLVDSRGIFSSPKPLTFNPKYTNSNDLSLKHVHRECAWP